MNDILNKNLLHYGVILDIEEYQDYKGFNTVRTILYNEKFYLHHMIDGKVFSIDIL